MWGGRMTSCVAVSTKKHFERLTWLRGLSAIKKAVPPGRDMAIALRLCWPLRFPLMWETRKHNLLITCKTLRLIDPRYGTKNKISLPMLKNFRASVEFHYHTIPFWIFVVFLRKFQKTVKNRNGTVPEFYQHLASVEFHYHTIPFRIFWGWNKTVRWMVKILQVLKIYIVGIAFLK